MQMPYDSLDDFASSIDVPQKPEDPPAARWLQFSGEVEVLKPLVSAQQFAAHEPATIDETPEPPPTAGNWYSGQARTLALAGSFAIVALVLAAVFIGTYRPRVEPASTGSDVAVTQPSKDVPAQTENLAGPGTNLADPLTETDTPSVSDTPRAIRAAIRPHTAVSRGLRAFYRPRRSVPKPQIVNSGFAPTTLVIYVEKGEIKTRVEPQLTSSFRKPAPLQN